MSAQERLTNMTSSSAAWTSPGYGTAVDTDSRPYRWLGNVALALIVVGFPLVAGISQIVGAQTNTISIAYRVMYLILVSILALLTLSRGKFRVDYLMLLFLVACVARITADYFYGTFFHVGEDFQFFAATVLIPVLCLAGGRDWYRERLFSLLVVGIGSTANLIAIYALKTDLILLREADTGAVDRSGLSTLDPISLGYSGLFTGIAALLLVLQRPGWRWNPLLLLLIVPAAYLMIIAASRGPFVALIVGMVVIGLANRRASIASIAISLIGMGAVAYLGAPEGILNRFAGVGYDASSTQRLDAVFLSISEALDHPFFGYAYIEPVTGIHPHNMLAESGMALGLGGAALMAWMQLSLVGNAVAAAARRDVLLAFLAMAQFVNAWLSGSIWESAIFFAFLWLLRDHRHPVDTRDAVRASGTP